MKSLSECTDEGSLLLVDDDEELLELLQLRLQNKGYEVLTAASGRLALERLKEHSFDLILLDALMPEIDGFTFLTTIRKMYTMAQLPVIVLSAQADKKSLLEGLELGANDYVVKPSDFSVILARIRTQLLYRSSRLALLESETRYALAARGANDGLWDWDLRTNEFSMSPRWSKMFGLEEREHKGLIEDWFGRVHLDDRKGLQAAIDAHLQHHAEVLAHEHRILHKDGGYRWVFCRGVALFDAQGEAIRMAGSKTNITEHKGVDPLTGALTKTLFVLYLGYAVRRARREDRGVQVLVIGLDGIAEVFARQGEARGGQLLRELKRRLESCLRVQDSLARVSLAEFACLLDGVETDKEVRAITKALKRESERPFQIHGEEVHLQAWIGGRRASPDEEEEQLFAKAQAAMEHARQRRVPVSGTFEV